MNPHHGLFLLRCHALRRAPQVFERSLKAKITDNLISLDGPQPLTFAPVQYVSRDSLLVAMGCSVWCGGTTIGL